MRLYERITLSITIIITVNLTNPAGLYAQEYEVSGTLIDDSGVPVAGQSILLLDDESEEVQRDSTDADGRFSLVYEAEPTSVDPSGGSEAPSSFQLGSSYPNPFNPRTRIPFYAPENSRASLTVYNVLGQAVLSGQADVGAGNNEIIVNLGSRLSQGQYILVVQGEGYSLSESMTFLSAGIGGGLPEIRVQSGGHQQARMESAEMQTISTGEFRLVVEASEEYLGLEVTISPMQDVELGSIVLPLRSPAICDDLNLVAESSMPAHMIELEGFSEEFGEVPVGWLYDAEFYNEFMANGNGSGAVPDDTLRHAVYIEPTEEEGLAHVLVPVHPVDYMGGGEGKLVIISEDEIVGCPALPLEIEPMPPATVTIESLIYDFTDALDELARAFGEDPEDLRARPISSLEPHLIHVGVGLQALDGEGNEGSLISILEGTAAVLDGEEPDAVMMELVDAVFDVTGTSARFGEINDNIRQMAEMVESVFDDVAEKQRGRSDSSDGAEIAADKITSARMLDIFMQLQQEYADMNSGLMHEVREFSALALGSVSVTTAFAATAVPAIAPVAATTGAAGVYLSVTQIINDLIENTLPSELLGLDIFASPTIYNEDNGEMGEWIAALEATSAGWVLDFPTALGLVPGAGKVAEVLAKGPGIRKMAGETVEFIVSMVQTHMTHIWETESGIITFDPSVWLVYVDTETDEDYFNWNLQTVSSETGAEPFELDEDMEEYYTPLAVGTSELRVSTEFGVFLDQFREERIELQVNPIELSITKASSGGGSSSPPFYVERGGEVDLIVNVSNAEVESISWIIYDEGFTMDSGTENPNLVTYFAPDEPGTQLLIARSTAEGGARNHPGAPIRSTSARVVVLGDGLVVTPDIICLESHDTQQFRFYFDGEEVTLDDLVWDMTGPGSMGSDGDFVPVAEGDVSLSFYHPDDPEDIQQISFTVSDICSYMRLNSAFFDHRSECLTYIEIPGLGGQPISGSISNSMNDPFSFDMTILGNKLQESGDWSAQIPWGDSGSSTNISLWVATGIDEDGSLLPGIARWLVSESIEMAAWPLNAERRVRTVNGQEVQAWYGTFFLPVIDHDRYVQTEQKIETIVVGEFSGILPGEHGCFD